MLYFTLIIVITVITIWISIKSNLLRDSITDPDQFIQIAVQTKQANPKPPFSLAKTQMAFWTIIILSSFLYIYFSSGSAGIVPNLSEVSLILLGIGVGTTTIGQVIDSNQQDKVRHQDQPSKGFLIDMLSDNDGVSIHRLQNVVWTFVVGIIYVRHVFDTATFPDYTVISQTLLGLMGISSGAYLGMKVNENTTSKADVESGDAPNPITKTDIADPAVENNITAEKEQDTRDINKF